ncbi:DUF1835 domain-containing protein [Winogradskyella sp. A3E31]|uniref:DUF1835 domain-containing protein n=1 Tax=Winogradskyella sp. A3E31 TaxID=3349637 RepID=UPI00398AD01B
MSKQILHITNGYSLTNNMVRFGYTDEILTWQEMLCEGPTIPKIDSAEFFNIRTEFLKEFYDIEVNQKELETELALLDDANKFDEIVLWFEYDLFCHINLIGVINLLHQKEIKTPLSLVCSGRVEGRKELTGLSELNSKELKDHYEARTRLVKEDMELMIALWRTYNGTDHNIFKMYITQGSSFKYLSNCLKAHLKRFPNSKNGLSVLEETILKLIKENKVTTRNQLLGLCLNHQGYYGYGDIQFERLLSHMEHLFSESKNGFTLTDKGENVLSGEVNSEMKLSNNITYGAVNRLRYYFDNEENKLIKVL